MNENFPVFAIFAKKGTNEKVLLPVPKKFIVLAMVQLNRKRGGDWVYVERLKPGEGIVFSDGMTYKGFDGVSERYCDKIEMLYE
jgi:hypothetical protein